MSPISARSRSGRESVGKFLLYADAGAAWAHDKSSVTSFTVGPLSSFGSDTRWGWTLGGGIAYALTANWSLFAEYDYLSLGSKGETLNDAVRGQYRGKASRHEGRRELQTILSRPVESPQRERLMVSQGAGVAAATLTFEQLSDVRSRPRYRLPFCVSYF